MEHSTVQLIIIVFAVVLVLAAIVAALAGIGYGILGAIILFGMATQQGFIGIAAYLAAWVFLWPVMIPLCIVVGWLSSPDDEP